MWWKLELVSVISESLAEERRVYRQQQGVKPTLLCSPQQVQCDVTISVILIYLQLSTIKQVCHQYYRLHLHTGNDKNASGGI